MSCTSCDFVHVITCTKLGRTCDNMYKILVKNGFNLYNI